MANGVIVIDKPREWTSMDVCAKLRGLFREKRVGHAGTLDPMATGVLPVFIGRATRAVEFAADGDKEYVAFLRLGLTTTTQDVWGEPVEERPVGVGREELAAVLPRFTGPIQQVPPMYSAIKIGGKKLYDLARKGVEVERKARNIMIHELELLDNGAWPDGFAPAEHTFLLRVRCSKGTYVRTLCHDIGQALGCGGCMSGLRRTMAAGYGERDAVTLEQVMSADDPTALLAPVDRCFAHLPALTLTPSQTKCVRNGAAFTFAQAGEWRVYSPQGEFLALCRGDGARLVTVKSFFEV